MIDLFSEVSGYPGAVHLHLLPAKQGAVDAGSRGLAAPAYGLGPTQNIETAVPTARLEFAARYEAALDRYRARDFDAAAALLEALARDHPTDRSVARLLGLVQEFGGGSLPNDWDGTSNFQQK